MYDKVVDGKLKDDEKRTYMKTIIRQKVWWISNVTNIYESATWYFVSWQY